VQLVQLQLSTVPVKHVQLSTTNVNGLVTLTYLLSLKHSARIRPRKWGQSTHASSHMFYTTSPSNIFLFSKPSKLRALTNNVTKYQFFSYFRGKLFLYLTLEIMRVSSQPHTKFVSCVLFLVLSCLVCNCCWLTVYIVVVVLRVLLSYVYLLYYVCIAVFYFRCRTAG